jgi:hypothetical protein
MAPRAAPGVSRRSVGEPDEDVTGSVYFVGEPMVPPRSPSFFAAHGMGQLRLPAGEAGLRP